MATEKLAESVAADWQSLQDGFKKAQEEFFQMQQRQMEAFIEKNGLPPQSQKKVDDIIAQYGFRPVWAAMERSVYNDLVKPGFPAEYLPDIKEIVEGYFPVGSEWRQKCLAQIVTLEEAEKEKVAKAAKEKVTADDLLLDDIPMSASVKAEAEKRKASSGKK